MHSGLARITEHVGGSYCTRIFNNIQVATDIFDPAGSEVPFLSRGRSVHLTLVCSSQMFKQTEAISGQLRSCVRCVLHVP